MFRTIYNKNTGEIAGCQKLNDQQLQNKLAENTDWDYINLYTKGLDHVIVDVATKKLRRVQPPAANIPLLIRSKRKRLLDNSDWTQAADSPLSDTAKAEWAAYRQQLRDLPDDQGSVNSIDDVVWPTSPV
jgi:hypothetical protein